MLLVWYFFFFLFLSARDRTAPRSAALLKFSSQTLFSLADVLLVLAPPIRHTGQVLPGTARDMGRERYGTWGTCAWSLRTSSLSPLLHTHLRIVSDILPVQPRCYCAIAIPPLRASRNPAPAQTGIAIHGIVVWRVSAQAATKRDDAPWLEPLF